MTFSHSGSPPFCPPERIFFKSQRWDFRGKKFGFCPKVPPNPINSADLAEHYYFSNPDLVNPGDIVSHFGAPGEATLSATPYDRKVIGVVSEVPGLILGETNNNTKPVALSGRVPVRVHSRGGPIKPGDPITTSSMPGVGIKATQPGRIIGTALESWTGEGEGKILVLINLGYYIGEENDTALLVQPEEMVI